MTEEEIVEYARALEDPNKRFDVPRLSDKDFADFHKVTMIWEIDKKILTKEDVKKFKKALLMMKKGFLERHDNSHMKKAIKAIFDFYRIRVNELNK